MIIYSQNLNLNEMRIEELDKLIQELEGAKSLETALYYKHVKELEARIREVKQVRFEKAVDTL